LLSFLQVQVLQRHENTMTLHPQHHAAKVFIISCCCSMPACVLCALQAVENDSSLQDIQDAAEHFDPRTEQVFKYLQVISAAAMSFAHGEDHLTGVFEMCVFEMTAVRITSSTAHTRSSMC
jgi:phosphate/sulfate permease